MIQLLSLRYESSTRESFRGVLEHKVERVLIQLCYRALTRKVVLAKSACQQ